MVLQYNPEDKFDFSQFTKRSSQLSVDIERFRMDVDVAASSARTPQEQAIATAGKFACNTLLGILETGNYQPKEIVEILNLVVKFAATLYNFGVSDGISQMRETSEVTEKYNNAINNDTPEVQT